MYEVFRDWSATAPEKFNEADCRRTWDSITDDKENRISLGTLKWLAKKYENTPNEMFPPPETLDKMAVQAAQFIDLLFLPGEHFELTLKAMRNDKGKYFPLRSESLLEEHAETEQRQENLEKIKQMISSCPHGAWIALNPIKAEITGKAPCDADVTSFRYTLIEADDLTKEEQWAKIKHLHLPIQSVVWSGGKSLHVIVKIEAGTDRKLYDARVKALREYLDRRQFPYDRANKNPSRLTRLPGVRRDGDIQYLAAGEFGPKTWQEFEKFWLLQNRQDKRQDSSPLNGMMGGRPKTPVTDYAESFLADYKTANTLLTLRYWNGNWYLFTANGWKCLTQEEMKMRITGYLQRNNIQAQERISQNLISDILVNLQSDYLCGLPESKYRMPCWLPGGEDARGWMSFRNGILNLNALIANPDSIPEFIPISPALFAKDGVPYDYDPDATCPNWNYYLNTTFDSDEMRLALQMLFGYILSGETRLNVGFFWIGQGGDGKSTAAHILRKLVGESNTCCLPFGNLKDRFSTFQLTENKLNLVEELPVISEQSNITECEKVFKLVTDGGELNIERKYQPPTKAPATVRIVYAANALPQFVDRTKGLWDRLVILPFNHRFRGTSEERSDFKRELEKELPGICNWAIQGAQMLTSLTRFPVPEASRQMIEQHHAICDHETEFFKEWLQEDPEGQVGKQALYNAYANEMKDSGYRAKGKSNFNAALKIAFPDITEGRYREHGQDIQIWQGITLKAGANIYRVTY